MDIEPKFESMTNQFILVLIHSKKTVPKLCIHDNFNSIEASRKKLIKSYLIIQKHNSTKVLSWFNRLLQWRTANIEFIFMRNIKRVYVILYNILCVNIGRYFYNINNIVMDLLVPVFTTTSNSSILMKIKLIIIKKYLGTYRRVY